MKKYLLYCLISLVFHFSGYSQQDDQLPCGTVFPEQEWEDAFQDLINEFNSDQQHKKGIATAYTIPVIFHIVHGGEAIGNYPNLLAGQINAQIEVLNQDFSGNAYNAGNYPANAFVNWAINQALPAENLDNSGRVKIANFDIQFCLATEDPSGNNLPEPGIDRINFNTKGWPNPNLFSTQATFKNYLDNTVKPQSIWDVTQYLNIWITDKSTALNHAGVSSVPPLSGIPDLPNTATDSTDGIWCYAKATGSNALFAPGSYASPMVDGRTLTHEIGHYLGLRHIWGDAACGNDFCDDTPPAAAQNVGAPTYPFHVGTCASPSNNPDGEMFMNFMDYTVGPKKYMFTVDQMTRAQTAMLNSPFRKFLGTHEVCSMTTELDIVHVKNRATVSPNPTTGMLRVDVPNEHIVRVQIQNAIGEVLQEHHSASFSMAELANSVYVVTVDTDAGRYVLKVEKR